MPHDLNFLEHEEQASQLSPRKRRHIRSILIGLLIVFIGWIVVVSIATGQVIASAFDGRDALLLARDAAIDLQFEEASGHLQDAETSFAKAKKGFFYLRPLRVVPWLGSQIRAAEAIVVSGQSVIDALGDVLDLGGELIRLSGLSEADIRLIMEGLSPTVTFDDLSSETKLAILMRLNRSASDLELTEAKIAIARAELSRINRDAVIAPVLGALEPVEERLAELQETIHILSIAAHLLPEFVGIGEEKTHLILFMNNAELRPGGGFIGTYGILNMENGDIQSLDTTDVYSLDRAAEPFIDVQPPAALSRYNATSIWFFRDSNWSPDFAISAGSVLGAYEREVRAISESQVPPDAEVAGIVTPQFDGVIGFTPDWAADLLEITGPLTAGGQTFDAQNVFDKLEYQVEFGYVGQGIPETQRKEILAQLVDEMKSALFSLPISEWVHVLQATEAAIENKQFVLFNTDEDAQSVIQRVGWGGVIEPKTSDKIMLVDANLAALKTDPAVERHLTYEIERNDSGEYIGRVTVVYNHTGIFDWKTTRYRTYTRLYVPEGSELLGVQGSLLNDRTQNPTGAAGPVDTEHDLAQAGFVTFGTFTSVEPGQSQTLVFEFALAESVERAIRSNDYALSFFKQIGAGNHSLTLDLDFDKNVSSATPSEDPNEWGDDRYLLNTKLDQDLEMMIEF